MSAFATAAELQELIGTGSLSEGRADAMLDYASSIIRRYTGQTLTAVETEEVTLFPSDTVRLFLPQRPVTAVDSVEVDGEVFTDFTVTRSGVLERSTVWDLGATVVYDHGYAADSEEMMVIRTVCLNVAARGLTMNKAPMFEEFGGGVSEAAGFAPELWLSPAEKILLADFGKSLVG